MCVLRENTYTKDSRVSGLDARRDGDESDWPMCGSIGLIIGMTSLIPDVAVSAQSVK